MFQEMIKKVTEDSEFGERLAGVSLACWSEPVWIGTVETNLTKIICHRI